MPRSPQVIVSAWGHTSVPSRLHLARPPALLHRSCCDTNHGGALIDALLLCTDLESCVYLLPTQPGEEQESGHQSWNISDVYVTEEVDLFSSVD